MDEMAARRQSAPEVNPILEALRASGTTVSSVLEDGPIRVNLSVEKSPFPNQRIRTGYQPSAG
jgi:hypothetical protein